MAKTLDELFNTMQSKEIIQQEKQSWGWFLKQAREVRTTSANIRGITARDVIKDKNVPKLTKIPTQIRGQGSIIGKLVLFQFGIVLK